ncbi:SDR family oxidoreductase [Gloeobacter violaceus]|uniref:Gll2891 protein n=1 Tax=Gloeobacter violaceus (strain ATCC 29082 / PCC 7421) TaxID=251221 RepID=Q7NCT5_GLOVI|nr:SDR family oxidoreductase [Gloeobacter violaceus]BAC90832.1 gll2891 [Gloeobacter violaceus PCC 7421]
MILITGATGNNGVEIVRLLAQKNISARALVRDSKRAGAVALPHIEVVEGNFDRPETLLAALVGVDRAFLLTPSSERAESQQLAFIDAARQIGIRHIVKLSQFGADTRSEGRFQRYHAVVEAAVRASGLACTFLRPNLFMQGLLNFRAVIAARQAFYAAAGDAKVSIVDVRDVAEVAVAALTESGHEGKTYELTGPEALTHTEMAEHLSASLGHHVAFVDIPPEAMGEALRGAGLPPWQAEGLIEEYALYRRGEAEAITSGVQDAIGRTPRSFNAFARDYAAAFS